MSRSPRRDTNPMPLFALMAAESNEWMNWNSLTRALMGVGQWLGDVPEPSDTSCSILLHPVTRKDIVDRLAKTFASGNGRLACARLIGLLNLTELLLPLRNVVTQLMANPNALKDRHPDKVYNRLSVLYALSVIGDEGDVNFFTRAIPHTDYREAEILLRYFERFPSLLAETELREVASKLADPAFMLAYPALVARLDQSPDALAKRFTNKAVYRLDQFRLSEDSIHRIAFESKSSEVLFALLKSLPGWPGKKSLLIRLCWSGERWALPALVDMWNDVSRSPEIRGTVCSLLILAVGSIQDNSTAWFRSHLSSPAKEIRFAATLGVFAQEIDSDIRSQCLNDEDPFVRLAVMLGEDLRLPEDPDRTETLFAQVHVGHDDAWQLRVIARLFEAKGRILPPYLQNVRLMTGAWDRGAAVIFYGQRLSLFNRWLLLGSGSRIPGTMKTLPRVLSALPEMAPDNLIDRLEYALFEMKTLESFESFAQVLAMMIAIAPPDDPRTLRCRALLDGFREHLTPDEIVVAQEYLGRGKCSALREGCAKALLRTGSAGGRFVAGYLQDRSAPADTREKIVNHCLETDNPDTLLAGIRRLYIDPGHMSRHLRDQLVAIHSPILSKVLASGYPSQQFLSGRNVAEFIRLQTFVMAEEGAGSLLRTPPDFQPFFGLLHREWFIESVVALIRPSRSMSVWSLARRLLHGIKRPVVVPVLLRAMIANGHDRQYYESLLDLFIEKEECPLYIVFGGNTSNKKAWSIRGTEVGPLMSDSELLTAIAEWYLANADLSVVRQYRSRRIIISPATGTERTNVSHPYLTISEFDKIAAYIKVTYLDESEQTILGEVIEESDTPTAEIVNALHQFGKVVIATVHWC